MDLLRRKSTLCKIILANSSVTDSGGISKAVNTINTTNGSRGGSRRMSGGRGVGMVGIRLKWIQVIQVLSKATKKVGEIEGGLKRSSEVRRVTSKNY